MKTIEERIAKCKFREGHIGAFVVRVEDAEEIAEEYVEEYAKAFAQFVTDRYDPAKSENDILSDIEVSNYMAEFKESLKK